MKVAVVGCGYVGLVSAVGLATVGHEVVGIEAEPGRRRQLAAGTPPFHEPGLEDALRKSIHDGRLRVSADLADACAADVVLLAVQTPPDESGAIDLQYLRAAAASLADAFDRAPRSRVVVTRSTVVPGTADDVLVPLFTGTATRTAVASNPEFLREGSALTDFLQPDRIVVGCHDDWGRQLLAELYEPLGAPIVHTVPAAAELAKYVSNTFLATMISFSNQIAHICERVPGVDVEDVLDIVHLDRRWRPAPNGSGGSPGMLSYLRAGCGFGGSCLPKDLSALIAYSAGAGVHVPLLEAVREINDGQPGRLVEMAADALGGLRGRAVGVLGLAFKAGTDDLRDSPGLKIVRLLVAAGADVRVYDPLVSPQSLPPDLAGQVAPAETLEDAVAGAEACVVTTTAPEFSVIEDLVGKGAERGPVVIDGRRALPASLAQSAAAYRAVGVMPSQVAGGMPLR